MFDVDLRIFLDKFKGTKRVIYNNWNEVVNIKTTDVDEIYKFLSTGWEVKAPYYDEETKKYVIQYR